MALKRSLYLLAALGLMTYVVAQGGSKTAAKGAATSATAAGSAAKATAGTAKKTGKDGKKAETLEEIEARRKSLLMYDENYILHVGSHNSVEFEEMVKQKGNATVVTLVYASKKSSDV